MNSRFRLHSMAGPYGRFRAHAGVLQPSRRQTLGLGLLAASVLAGCGGGDPDTPSLTTAIHRERAAAALASVAKAGFVFLGPTQTLQIGAAEQFIQVGRASRVLIAPVTTGVSLYAAPGVPVALTAEDEMLVTWPAAAVLDVAGARGFNLRCNGPSVCTVTLFLGA